ncbi:DUF6745 domain-containing protein [Floridanema aerugineum]|uniref:DUF6745 domain-containing protein n=1 Tax=Floridaenema aerugineum BLCC-F46 TaxID=3153654 RepID=A0ABV4WZ07_9CYAN
MLPTDLSPKAQQIIDRLSAIDYENPNIDEQRIRDAFSRLLKALNQHDRPVEIYRSFDAAFDAASEVMFFDAAWQKAINAAWKVVYDPQHEAALEAAREGASAATSDAALETVRKAAFDAGLAAAKKGMFDFDAASDAPHFSVAKAAREAAFRTAKKTAIDPLWNKAWNIAFDMMFPWAWREASKAASSAARTVKGAAKQAAWGDAFNAAFRQLWVSGRSSASMVAWHTTREEAADIPRNLTLAAVRSVARIAVLEAAFDGNQNSAWRNRNEVATEAAMAVEIADFITSSRQYKRLSPVWMPFVDALEAGLFCFWITQTKVMVLTSPVMRIQNEQLHADGKPAVQWSDWECYYFWRGVPIPQKYGAVLSQNWRSQWLLQEPNAELRRVLIQGIGYDRIVQDLEAVELDAWREYSLLMVQADIDVEPICLLKMTCPSTNHIHVLRTPPDITSAREAIAWCNWDIDPETFVVES